ncbi:hypothetical protein BH20BAC1_BH20BAC1_05390 [soil metagenome]
MKKVFVLVAVAMLAACNASETTDNDNMASGEDSAMSKSKINSPYAIEYSSDFEMDDPKNAESVLTIWKDWDAGNLAAHKELFADSVEMHFADGTMMHNHRDSVLAAGQQYRSTLAKVESSIAAITAMKSVDKNENWALVWGKEIDTDKSGKVDSFYLQETWRFNKNGQADLVYQYKQAAPPPKK